VQFRKIVLGSTLTAVTAGLVIQGASSVSSHSVFASTTPAGPIARMLRLRHGWIAPDADTKHPWLYVNSPQNNVIVIYDLQKVGIPQIGQITDGLDHPTAMMIDSSGTLYVTNYYGGTVSIYAAGSTQPTLTLSSGLSVPNGVALDASGNLYVSNKSTPPNVVVFPPGQTTPSETISDPLIQNPGELVFDAAGNLYLADSNTGISELSQGSQHFTSLNLQGLSSFDGAVAIDPLDGNLFVSGTNGSSNRQGVLVFPSRGSERDATAKHTGVGGFPNARNHSAYRVRICSR
jgi:hypothetical protein